jgi:GT2 family glycosyltransferase/ubiquinone/menaquinone biosynthesis C-methylase UbiE
MSASPTSPKARQIAEAAARVHALQSTLYALEIEAESLRNRSTADQLEIWRLKNSWSYRVGRIVVAPASLAKFLLREKNRKAVALEMLRAWVGRDPSAFKPILFPPPPAALRGPSTPLTEIAGGSDADKADAFLKHLAEQEGDLIAIIEARRRELEHAKNLEILAKREIAGLKGSWSYRVGKLILSPVAIFKKALGAPAGPSPIPSEGKAPEPYSGLKAEREAAEIARPELEARRDTLKRKPLFSIITPVYNTDPEILRETLDSVLAQIYDNWQLCLADDCSDRDETRATLAEYAEKHPDKIKTTRLEKNSGIAVASNRAADLAEGEFLCLLDHDDILAPDALLAVAESLNAAYERGEGHETDLIYSDQDRLTLDGQLIEPYYKPDFSPELLLSGNYITHFSTIRASLFRELGGFREGFDGSQDYDLILRVTEKARAIQHVPKVLYHWKMIPGSTAQSDKAKGGPWRESSKEALRSMIARRGWKATVENAEIPSHYRVRFDTNPQDKVAIIVPTKDRVDLLKALLNSIEEKTEHPNYEVLVVCNNCEDAETFRYLEAENKESGGKVRHIRLDIPFNFSRINNLAVAQTDAPYLLFLNNDIEVLRSGWLSAMLEHAQRSEIGAVGAKLLYPSGRVQHAGVILGLHGIAGHSHVHFPRDSPGYFGHARLVKNYSAVTAACLMTRRDVFERVGGFNEALAVAFNDVDWCLRVRAAGYRIVFTPYAELCHKESESRGDDLSPRHERRFHSEISFMLDKWGETLFRDPCHNPNLTLWRLDFSARNAEDEARTAMFKTRYRRAETTLLEARRQPTGATEAERALAILPRWTSVFHLHGRATPAAAALDSDRDERLAALNERFSLRGRRVLDLRSGEGAGDKQLADLGAESAGIEPDSENYLKRALVKSALQLESATLWLGSPEEIVPTFPAEERFDVCLADGAFGQAEKPLELLDCLAERADRIIVWSSEVASGDAGSWNALKDAAGREYRGRHRLRGHESPLLGPTVFLLAKDDFLQAFRDRGFEIFAIESQDSGEGRFISLEASREAASESYPQAVEKSGEGRGKSSKKASLGTEPAAAPALSRGRYKEVWTALSDTEENAKKHVLAFVDERRYKIAGERTVQVLRDTVGIQRDDVVLEIGCGIGRVGEALAPVCREWIGCDVSPNMVALARKRLSHFDNVRVLEVSGADLAPVDDASVDVVYCTVVFMHLEEWDRYNYVLEAKRVLRPGGRLYIDNFTTRSEVGWEVFERHRLAFAPGERPPHMSVSSTLQELEVYLQRAGFENIQLAERDEYAQAWAVKPQ